jgi:hypothetical protein
MIFFTDRYGEDDRRGVSGSPPGVTAASAK